MDPPFVVHARLGFPLPDNAVPIPEWNQLGAFSTVKACERARRRLLENVALRSCRIRLPAAVDRAE